MTKIYEQHDAAFRNVEAHIILKDNERVAKIAFKFPKDGAGKLYAYVHWYGTEMVRGHANGYGYDKRSAAIESAMVLLRKKLETALMGSFVAALADIGGNRWHTALEEAGFTVYQAI